jgi:hypothetical protein
MESNLKSNWEIALTKKDGKKTRVKSLVKNFEELTKFVNLYQSDRMEIDSDYINRN